MVGPESDSQTYGVSFPQWEATVGGLFVATKHGVLTETVDDSSKILARVRPFDLVTRQIFPRPEETCTGLQRMFCKLCHVSESFDVDGSERIISGWATLCTLDESFFKPIPGVSRYFESLHLVCPSASSCPSTMPSKAVEVFHDPVHPSCLSIHRKKQIFKPRRSVQTGGCIKTNNQKWVQDEVAFYQGLASPKLLLPEASFQRLVKSVVHQDLGKEYKFTPAALKTLQFGCESHLVETFASSVLLAAHAHRREVRPTDIKLLQRVRS